MTRVRPLGCPLRRRVPESARISSRRSLARLQEPSASLHEDSRQLCRTTPHSKPTFPGKGTCTWPVARRHVKAVKPTEPRRVLQKTNDLTNQSNLKPGLHE